LFCYAGEEITREQLFRTNKVEVVSPSSIESYETLIHNREKFHSISYSRSEKTFDCLVLLEDYRVGIILGIFKINENIYVHVEVKPIIEKKHKNFNIISKDEKEDRIFLSSFMSKKLSYIQTENADYFYECPHSVEIE
jgi:hypothetical protein